MVDEAKANVALLEFNHANELGLLNEEMERVK